MPLHSLRDGQRAAIDPIPGTGSAEHAIGPLCLGGSPSLGHFLKFSCPFPAGAAPGPLSTKHWTYGMAGMPDSYTHYGDQPLLINKNARPLTFDSNSTGSKQES